jgi:hypothetical protein
MPVVLSGFRPQVADQDQALLSEMFDAVHGLEGVVVGVSQVIPELPW